MFSKRYWLKFYFNVLWNFLHSSTLLSYMFDLFILVLQVCDIENRMLDMTDSNWNQRKNVGLKYFCSSKMLLRFKNKFLNDLDTTYTHLDKFWNNHEKSLFLVIFPLTYLCVGWIQMGSTMTPRCDLVTPRALKSF